MGEQLTSSTDQRAPFLRRDLAWYPFLVLTASLGFMKPTLGLGGQHLTATDLLFPIVLLLWLVTLATGHRTFRFNKFHAVLLFYLATLALSTAFSADVPKSLVKLGAEAYLIGLAVITFSVVDSEDRLRKTLLAWLAGAVVPLVIGVGSVFIFYALPDSRELLEHTTSHYGAVPAGNFPRLSSTFVSASMFCNYLTVTLLAALILRKKSWIPSSIFIIALLLIAVCAVFTVSIGLGGLFLAIGLWMLISGDPSRSNMLRAAAWALVALSIPFLVPAVVALEKHATAPYFITLPVTGTEFHPSPRLMVWQDAWNTFQGDVLTGRGLGLNAASTRFANTDGTFSLLTDAHNIFLSVAAQNGILAVIAIFLLILYLVNLSFRATYLKKPGPVLLIGLGIAFASAFIYQGLTGSFEDARHLWLLIGLIPAAASLNTDT